MHIQTTKKKVIVTMPSRHIMWMALLISPLLLNCQSSLKVLEEQPPEVPLESGEEGAKPPANKQ